MSPKNIASHKDHTKALLTQVAAGGARIYSTFRRSLEQ